MPGTVIHCAFLMEMHFSLAKYRCSPLSQLPMDPIVRHYIVLRPWIPFPKSQCRLHFLITKKTGDPSTPDRTGINVLGSSFPGKVQCVGCSLVSSQEQWTVASLNISKNAENAYNCAKLVSSTTSKYSLAFLALQNMETRKTKHRQLSNAKNFRNDTTPVAFLDAFCLIYLAQIVSRVFSREIVDLYHPILPSSRVSWTLVCLNKPNLRPR